MCRLTHRKQTLDEFFLSHKSKQQQRRQALFTFLSSRSAGWLAGCRRCSVSVLGSGPAQGHLSNWLPVCGLTSSASKTVLVWVLKEPTFGLHQKGYQLLKWTTVPRVVLLVRRASQALFAHSKQATCSRFTWPRDANVVLYRLGNLTTVIAFIWPGLFWAPFLAKT